MGGLEDFMRRDEKDRMQVNCNGTIITLPEDFTWILIRHGEKTKKGATREGRLTLRGRRQMWGISFKLIEEYGQDAMEKSPTEHSPVPRVRESTNIYLSANGRPLNDAVEVNEKEWGPDDGHDKDLAAIKSLINRTIGETPVTDIGHNGLAENIANIIHPLEEGYHLPAGAAFIITPNGVELMESQDTA